MSSGSLREGRGIGSGDPLVYAQAIIHQYSNVQVQVGNSYISNMR